MDNLLKPENKKTLDKILTYHVVPGRIIPPLSIATLRRETARPNLLKTVEGDTLTVCGSGKVLLYRREGRTSESHHCGRLPVERRHHVIDMQF